MSGCPCCYCSSGIPPATNDWQPAMPLLTLTGSKLGWITPLLGDAFLTCTRVQAQANQPDRGQEAREPSRHMLSPRTQTQIKLVRPTSAIRPGLPVRSDAALMAPMKSLGAGLALAAPTSIPSGTLFLRTDRNKDKSRQHSTGPSPHGGAGADSLCMTPRYRCSPAQQVVTSSGQSPLPCARQSPPGCCAACSPPRDHLQGSDTKLDGEQDGRKEQPHQGK
jgi:hypothetical protein